MLGGFMRKFVPIGDDYYSCLEASFKHSNDFEFTRMKLVSLSG